MSATTLVAVLTFNEGEKLKRLVASFPEQREYDLLFVDDGSTDDSPAYLARLDYPHIRHEDNQGVGASIRDAIDFARKNDYHLIVVMAGNGKMQAAEIPRLLAPLVDDTADYVQGSRYLEGGQSPNLPFGRRVAIRLFTRIVNLFSRFKGTDITCGFRAYRLDLLDHPEIDISQSWLNRYELEYYLHYKVIKLGYRVAEAPVSMVYPEEKRNYTKIRPFTGWWSMVRPWVFLTLGIKK
jgi:dolichol-phosphate mannosyltransferase